MTRKQNGHAPHSDDTLPNGAAALLGPIPDSLPGLTGGSATPILTPPDDFLDQFRSTEPVELPGVVTPLAPLKILRASETGDFFRVHPDTGAYWTGELCFVLVPVKGARPMWHLINQEIAQAYLSPTDVKRQRLVLASRPHDAFFFCIVPSRNIEQAWNATALAALELARSRWVQVFSRRGEGIEEYGHKFARDEDAFPAPRWPTRPLSDYIRVTFNGNTITAEDHPGLLRLIGAKQDLG